jgi:hypothetical protein
LYLCDIGSCTTPTVLEEQASTTTMGLGCQRLVENSSRQRLAHDNAKKGDRFLGGDVTILLMQLFCSCYALPHREISPVRCCFRLYGLPATSTVSCEVLCQSFIFRLSFLSLISGFCVHDRSIRCAQASRRACKSERTVAKTSSSIITSVSNRHTHNRSPPLSNDPSPFFHVPVLNFLPLTTAKDETNHHD